MVVGGVVRVSGVHGVLLTLSLPRLPTVASGANALRTRPDAPSVSGVTQGAGWCCTVGMELELPGSVPAEARRALVDVAVRRRFRRGEVLFHEGDLADTVHLVVEGRVVARRGTPAGDTVILSVAGPGELLGEMALLSADARRTTTVVALEPVVSMVVGFGDLERLRRMHPALDRMLLDLLAARVRRLSDHLLEALHLAAEQRVVRRLEGLASTYPAAAAGPVVVPLTQSEIGELSGASRPVTNRVLRRLEDEGLVRLARGAVTVVDREGLARRARC